MAACYLIYNQLVDWFESEKEGQLANEQPLNILIGALFVHFVATCHNEKNGLLAEDIRKVSGADVDPNFTKLWPIFDAYSWTANDNASWDRILNPSMMGMVYEGLVGRANGTEPLALPASYKDMDRVRQDHDDLACETLAFSVAKHVDGVEVKEALAFLRSEGRSAGHSWREIKKSPDVFNAIHEHLCDVTIYDTSVGTGGFLIAVLNALCAGQNRLIQKIRGTHKKSYLEHKTIEKAIVNQMHGVGVAKLAVNIAKFRLYLQYARSHLNPEFRPTTEEFSQFPFWITHYDRLVVKPSVTGFSGARL